MKNAGPPWLGRSDVSGNFRHAARTLASASATSRSENRLTLPPIFSCSHNRAVDPPPLSSLAEEKRLRSLLLRAAARDSPALAARAERSQTGRIRLRSLLVMELFDSLLD